MEKILKIILVEDEPAILRGLAATIDMICTDCEVVATALNGEKALELIQIYQPDVAFTDIQMPCMNGLDLIEKARTVSPRTSFVILTGYADFSYAQKAVRLQVREYLLKPVDPEELKRIIQYFLNRLHSSPEDEKKESFPVSGVHTRMSPGESLACEVKSYLERNFTSPVTGKDFYDLFGYNEKYISRVFKEYFQITPSRYISKLRLRAAKELMKNNPSMLFKDVALAVGYEDPLYFSRVFKNTFGVSPKTYQEDLRKSRKHEVQEYL